jgi:undecaprenyl diphosphate synthase
MTSNADKLTAPPAKIPRHVAIIMDGNGRWAESRNLPRVAGHRAGVETVRNIVKLSGEYGVEALTLFAFSSENWRRPKKEVSLLMELFLTALDREVGKLHNNNVQLRVIGHKAGFPAKLQRRIVDAERLTADNTGLKLSIAANYGGHWDMAEAAKALARQVARGELDPDAITPEHIGEQIALNDLPEPDLFIRTGGEQRISNFLIWQLAYTELYFTDTLWPDFDAEPYLEALHSFATRQRRFGHTGEQIQAMEQAKRA